MRIEVTLQGHSSLVLLRLGAGLPGPPRASHRALQTQLPSSLPAPCSPQRGQLLSAGVCVILGARHHLIYREATSLNQVCPSGCTPSLRGSS